MNLFDNKPTDPSNPVNYDGYRIRFPKAKPKFDTAEPPEARIETVPSDPAARAALFSKLEEDQIPMWEFEQVASQSIGMAVELKNRITAGKALIASIGISVKLDDIKYPDGHTAADDLEKFIGVREIDHDAADCLNRLANYSDAATAYTKANDTPKELRNARTVVDEAFKEDRIKEAFPKFGFELVWMVVVLCVRMVITIVLGKLCEAIHSLLSGIKIPIVNIAVDPDLWNVCNTFNDGGHVAMVFMDTLTIAVNLLSRTWGGKAVPLYTRSDPYGAFFTFDAKRKIRVCCGSEPFDIANEVMKMLQNEMIPDKLPEDENGNLVPVKRCDPDYIPSYEDISRARQFVELGIQKELNAVNGVVNRDATSTDTNHGFTEFSLLDRMSSDVEVQVETSKYAVDQIKETSNYWASDNVQRAALDFFMTVNAICDGIDRKVTDVLAVVNMAKEYQQWICCIIRLIFIVMPRAFIALEQLDPDQKTDELLKNEVTKWLLDNKSTIAGNFARDKATELHRTDDNNVLLSAVIQDLAKNAPSVQKDAGSPKINIGPYIINITNRDDWRASYWAEFYMDGLFLDGIEGTWAKYGAKDDFLKYMEVTDDIKLWIFILDSVISLLLGTTTVKIDMKFGNLFMDALKAALSESLSVLMTAIYKDLKQEIFGKIQDMKAAVPELKAIFEACAPFDWFIKSLECSFEGLFASFQGILAQIWADANAGLQNVDLTLAVISNHKSLKLFQALFKMLKDIDTALINFCSVKRNATDAEKQEVIRRAINGVVPPNIPSNISDSERKLLISKLKAVYNPNFDHSLDNGLSTIENRQYTAQGSPLYKASFERTFDIFHNGNIPPEEWTVAPPIVDSPLKVLGPDGDPLLKDKVKSCGEEIKQILFNRLNEYNNEINKALRI